eukprot:TRINITY_DN90886_c0_g1_i1.p1 TRINITY_DN90886_c0_g1~~TRINITY_DN90886_c0_g1_i1.p1  ORF type:complete len:760 (+),score=155.97 TRINITY_DN90886_c0_g1_i1:176-2281(+)
MFTMQAVLADLREEQVVGEDDECSSGEACALNALQRHGAKQTSKQESDASHEGEDEEDASIEDYDEFEEEEEEEGIEMAAEDETNDEDEEEEGGEHPPLCDADVVAQSCKNLNKLTKEYFNTAADESLEIIHASELAEQLMASRESIQKFLKDVHATNVETDPEALSLGAFGVKCSELCKKTVGFLPASHVPPTSDIGCYRPAGKSQPVCDIDLSSTALQKIQFGTKALPQQQKERRTAAQNHASGSEDFRTLKRLVHSQKVNSSEQLHALEELHYPDEDGDQLAIQIANLFRIYPMARISATNSAQVNHSVAAASALEIGSGDSDEASNWQNDVMKVGVQAQGFTARSLRQLNTPKGDEMLVRWFGSSDGKSKTEVRRVLNSVNSLLSNVAYQYPGKSCKPNTFAYVFPNPPHNQNNKGQFVFHLCDLYMKADLSEQVETLVHEGSHHRVSLTLDVCAKGSEKDCVKAYGRIAGTKLAKKMPDKALKNADNYCYFVNDVQPGEHEPECPKTPTCSKDATCICKGSLSKLVATSSTGSSCNTCVASSKVCPLKPKCSSHRQCSCSDGYLKKRLTTKSGKTCYACEKDVGSRRRRTETASTDTGGSCRFFWCSHSRGPTQCAQGRCLCKEGYFAVNGKCTLPTVNLGASSEECESTDTGGTCRLFYCSRTRGDTECSNGKCVCKAGTCASQGICTSPAAAKR